MKICDNGSENLIDIALEEWKNSEVPVVIWGNAMLMGGRIAVWLDEQGVKYDAIAANREYLKLNDDGRTVCLEDYLKKNRCSLIVGFRGYRKEMLDKLQKEKIVKVYVYDFQGRLAAGCDSKITTQMLEEHSEEMRILRNCLADEISRNSLDDYIHQKRYGEYKKPSYSENMQYFDPDIISFGKGEVFVDCGGYDGADTAHFFDSVRDDLTARAFVFEPDPVNYENIVKKFREDNRVTVYNKGTGDINDQLNFESGKRSASRICEGGDAVVEINKLDDVIGDVNVSFLKMDIEGVELKALHGAERIIRKCRPKMAICIYHKAEDLWTIPQYILSLHNNYKLYIRSYDTAGIETVLYAI